MNNDEFQELATLYLEGAIDANGLERLNKELASSPERVREFNDLRLLVGGISEYGRSIVDSQSPTKPKKVSRAPHRFVWFAAAAACAVLGVTVWMNRTPGKIPTMPGGHSRTTPPLTTAMVAPGWLCETRGARYSVLSPGHVRLERGELYIKSVAMENGAGKRGALKIETPSGTAVTKGTEFYVGNHATEESKKGDAMSNLKSKMRVLVLSGIVTLTNTFGTVAGEANDLLVADAKSAPVKETVKANSDFAIALYKQVIKDKKNNGKNVFFSPFSVSNALAMTAEGARGATAAEMARVMQFPVAARRQGEDVQLIPWRASLIHTGFQQLNSTLDRESNDPSAQIIRAKLNKLRDELVEAKKATKAARSGKRWECIEAERKLVSQINKLAPQVDKFELNIANAVWAERTCTIEKPFIDTIDKYYGTGAIRAADFKGNHEAERLRINGWVEDKTKDRIKNLIPEGGVKDVRMVLVNAIYFKGEWVSPFDKNDTRTVGFMLADGKRAEAETMHARGLAVGKYGAFNADGSLFNTPTEIAIDSKAQIPAKYPGKDGFAIATLPYKGEELSMVLLSPMSHKGLAAIETKLSSVALTGWLGKLNKRPMNVVLPKFKLETNYVLGKGGRTPEGILPAMGMKRAFTNPLVPGGADFSGIHKAVRPEDRLYIGKVLHKAFLDVNEKGTEAAAATAVIMPPGGIPQTMPFTPTFRADRPFLLLIRHNTTGSILFMGRVMNPTQV